ncbi:MAG: hypothetical protein WCW84_07545 [Sulfurimonas sp.]|jgi:hypothetical protein
MNTTTDQYYNEDVKDALQRLKKIIATNEEDSELKTNELLTLFDLMNTIQSEINSQIKDIRSSNNISFSNPS